MNLIELAGYSPNTIRSYRSHWKAHVLPKLGPDTLLADVTTSMIDTFLAEVRATTSQRTAGNVARSLSAGLSMARDKQVLERVPAFPKGWMRRATTRTSKTVTYTAGELDQLIDACEEKYRAAIVLASYAFLRSGEVAALRRDDISLGTLSVRVDEATKTTPGGLTVVGPPKSTSGYRIVPIAQRHRAILTNHLERYVPPAADSLPWSTRDGGLVRSRVLLNALRAACRECGLPEGRFHDLRHSGLTLYGQSGTTLAELMAVAGHSDVDAAMIYQHAGIEPTQALFERMAGM